MSSNAVFLCILLNLIVLTSVFFIVVLFIVFVYSIIVCQNKLKLEAFRITVVRADYMALAFNDYFDITKDKLLFDNFR